MAAYISLYKVITKLDEASGGDLVEIENEVCAVAWGCQG